jgi:hypothetical protein
MNWPLSILILALIVGLLVLAPWVGRVVASRVAEHAAPDRPRSSGYLLPSLVLSLVLFYVGLGEAALLGLFAFWGARHTWLLWPKPSATVPLALAVCLIGAQVSGLLRIYGSARVFDNRPLLPSSLLVDHIDSPNLLVCTDGSRIAIPGIRFRPNALTDNHEQLLWTINRSADPVRIMADPSQPSGYAAEVRVCYSCGNTFFPQFLPEKLPAYVKQDVADVLLGGLAVQELVHLRDD